MLVSVGLAATLLLYMNVEGIVYVSADSRSSGSGGSVRDDETKIFRCGYYGVVAMSGRTSIFRKAPSDLTVRTFDVGRALSRLCQDLKDDQPVEQVRALARGLYDRLQGEMLMLGSSLPQPVMEEEVPGRPPMLFSIIFATLVPEQKPAVFGIDFRVTQYNFSSPLEPSWTVFLQEPVGTSYSALFIAQGDCSDVATNLVRQSTDLADKDPVERIREIYRDVTGQPQCHRVGGPVNIAKIDNDGVHWISGRD